MSPQEVLEQTTLGTVFRPACGFEHVQKGCNLRKFFISDADVNEEHCEYSANSRIEFSNQGQGVHLYLSPCTDDDSFLLGVDRQTMDRMHKEWKLPSALFEHFQPRTGYFAMSHLIQRELCKRKVTLRFINLAMADFGYNKSSYSCFFRHDISRQVTLCLCIGWDSSSRQNQFLVDIERSAMQIVKNPLNLVYILLRQQAVFLSFKQPRHQGFYEYYHFAHLLGIAPGTETTPDFTKLIKNMYQTSLTVNEYCASSETLVRTTETLDTFNKLIGSQVNPMHQCAVLDLKERLEVLRNDLKDQISQFRSYNTIIQSEFSALYSLVSQRDNKVSLQTAEATRTIPQATRVDSSSMKIIAALTLIFLPATSVSTVFSTAFMNFDGVTRYFPLYLILCGVLTVLAVTAWRHYMRRIVRLPEARDWQLAHLV